MARIKTFTKEPSRNIGRITDVDCLYSTGKDVYNEQYVVLRTTGSKGTNVTQTLHIGKSSAAELVKILQDSLGI